MTASISATAETGATARRILVIWNPAAGLPTALRPGGSVEDLSRILERHGVHAEIRAPVDADEARAIVRQAVTDRVEIVVAAGGDGTVHLVAEDLLGSETVLGILPLGRVMNIARALGIERDIDVAADVLRDGEVRTIDTGEAVSRDAGVVPFFEAGSVGMNAAIFREVSRVDEGDPVSIPRTIWVALRYRPARMAVELDDGVITSRALMVAVSNGPYLGLGMTVAPEARLDDGKFDVRIFRRFSKGGAAAPPGIDRVRTVAICPAGIDLPVSIGPDHERPAAPGAGRLRRSGPYPSDVPDAPASLRVIVPRTPQSTTDSSTAGSVRRRM